MWTTVADKQQSLEKLHHFLLQKNGTRIRSQDSPTTEPSMIETSIVPTTTVCRNTASRYSPMSPSVASSTANNYLTTAMLLSSDYINQATAAAAAAAAVAAAKNNDSKLSQSLSVDTSSSPSPPPPEIITRMSGNGNGVQFLTKQQQHQQHTRSGSNGSFHSNSGGQSPVSVSGTALPGTPNSLFTIDSILAGPKSISNPNSPPSPTTHSPTPIRPARVPGLLHHPGLHLGHLAAAAASGFGATSDFLGEFGRRIMEIELVAPSLGRVGRRRSGKRRPGSNWGCSAGGG